MTIPLLWSENTRFVGELIRREYPQLTVVCDERKEHGVKCVSLTAVSFELESDEDKVVQQCVSIYETAKAASSTPVSVFVKGSRGTSCTTDEKIEGTFRSIYPAGITVFVVPDGVPSLGGLRFIPDIPTEPVTPSEAVLQATPAEAREILAFEVRFWNDDEASIVWAVDQSIALPLSAEDASNYLVELLPHYLAKIMANLGDCPPAIVLSQHMADWASQQLASMDESERDDASAYQPLFPAGVSLVEPREAEPRVFYLGRLIAKGGLGRAYGVVTENEPDGGEAFYAPVSVILLAEQLAARDLPVPAMRTIARAVALMCEEYAQGPRFWDSLASLETVPRDALLTARAVEGTVVE